MASTNVSAPIRRVAIACQGGASHTAFTAGALKQIFQDYASQWPQNGSTFDRYQIIGLSGTSGGSICAFLAWYGLITGGPSKACQLLDTFWGEGIAAATWLEELALQDSGLAVLRTPWGRVLQTLAELMGAPYLFDPQAIMDAWAAWHVGPLADVLAPRPEHVNTEKLFAKRDAQGRPLIDPSCLAHIGDIERKLQQISKIVSEIGVLPHQTKNSDARLCQIQALAREVVREIDAGIIAQAFQERIRAGLNEVLAWQADADFAAGKKKFVQPLPVLLLGAVDVLSGAFKAFDSRKGEISLDSVLASTILPELFRARTLGNQEYWDGLFSENPPVRGFVELPDEPDEKPDEIWLIKIDPRERLEPPIRPDAIADRRNELAGDLSLNQEVNAIEAMNRWLGKLNAASRRKYKHITILRMQLDDAAVQRFAGGALDYPSKMYRGREFILGLMAHGADQAQAFLPLARQKARLRRLVEKGWNRVINDQPLDGGALTDFIGNHVLVSFFDTKGAASTIFTGSNRVRAFITELKDSCLSALANAQPPMRDHTSIAPNLVVTIDDLIVEARGEPACPSEFLAGCRWTLRGTQGDPERVLDNGDDAAAGPRSVKIQGTWVSRIVNDRIAESWVWDTRNLIPQPRPLAPRDTVGFPSGKASADVVRRWLETGWRYRRLDLIDECFATDYVHNDCGYFPDRCDRASYKRWCGEHTLPKDLSVERLFTEADRVVVVLRWGGDQLGVVIYRVAGGEIQESWWTWNTQRFVVDAALIDVAPGKVARSIAGLPRATN